MDLDGAADQLYAGYVRQAYAFERPVGMLGVNLGIATLIPIALVLVAVVHRVRPAWLASVQPGIRWKYLLICLVVALVALNFFTVGLGATALFAIAKIAFGAAH